MSLSLCRSLAQSLSPHGTVQLTNVFNEAMETLRLGFEEMLDLSLHLDGQYNPGTTAMTPNAAINGLDYIVNMNPSALGIAGIAFGETWWHNHFDLYEVLIHRW